jgi:hypothetical protein
VEILRINNITGESLLELTDKELKEDFGLVVGDRIIFKKK